MGLERDNIAPEPETPGGLEAASVLVSVLVGREGWKGDILLNRQRLMYMSDVHHRESLSRLLSMLC